MTVIKQTHKSLTFNKTFKNLIKLHQLISHDRLNRSFINNELKKID